VTRVGVVALALAGVLWVGAAAAHSDQEPAHATPTPTPTVTVTATPEPTLPPCEYEDSDNCAWDAGEQGNGAGTSFVTLNGVTYYPDAEPAEGDEPGELWNGFLVGEVIVCPDGLEVAPDIRPDGTQWAACM